MRVAVVGATGRIGHRTVEALERRHHETVGISRIQGVDVYTGEGLVKALTGVDAVVDACSCTATDRDEAVAFFSRSTRNLLEAERQTGVRHHVLLSIAGLTRVTGNAHYAGKRAQEELVERSPVPWSIVPATHFHDFAEMVTTWTERDGSATIAPLLVQPIAPGDVGEILADVATGDPSGDVLEIAGPDPQDLVDMARRTYAARGKEIRLVPTWRGTLGPSMAGEVLLPGPDARLGRTTFDEWLAAGGT
jgi:uncharacterized protein YbjT (DUF2867 family)